METSLPVPTSWALVGAATGLRSSVGIAAVVTAADRRQLPGWLGGDVARPVAWLLAAGELAVDKMSSVSPRTSPPGLIPRLVLGGGSAALLARGTGMKAPVAALVGSTSALGAAFGGLAARNFAAKRIGPTAAALIEDVIAVTLAAAAVRLARSAVILDPSDDTHLD
jgi:uncharacterized membrane protein